MYVDGFINFVIKCYLNDKSIKVIRIGLRLIWFAVINVDQLELKTNVVTLI